MVGAAWGGAISGAWCCSGSTPICPHTCLQGKPEIGSQALTIPSGEKHSGDNKNYTNEARHSIKMRSWRGAGLQNAMQRKQEGRNTVYEICKVNARKRFS